MELSLEATENDQLGENFWIAGDGSYGQREMQSITKKVTIFSDYNNITNCMAQI